MIAVGIVVLLLASIASPMGMRPAAHGAHEMRLAEAHDRLTEASDVLIDEMGRTQVTQSELDLVLALDDETLARGLGQLVSPRLVPVLDDAWLADVDDVRLLLKDAHDPAAERFVFETTYPGFDLATALLLVDGVVEASAYQAFAMESVGAALDALLSTGELPPGYELVLDEDGSATVQPVGAEPQPDMEHITEEGGPTYMASLGTSGTEAVDDAPAEGYRDDAPLRAGPDPDPSITSTDEDQLHFFITDCPKCDQYLFASGSPITATFDLNGTDPADIEEGTVDLSAWDVDWGNTACSAGPERDAVLLNGNFVGYLTGADSSWSVSSFNLDPAWFVDGVNTVDVIIDSTGTGCWAVEVDWFDIRVNAPVGPVVITEQETDKDGYNLGEVVLVDTTVETEEEGPYAASVEWNLVRPDGNIARTKSQSVTLEKDTPVTLTEALSIGSSAGSDPTGKWTVQAIAFDEDGAKSDEEVTEISVGTDLIIVEDAIEISPTGQTAGDRVRADVVATVEATSAVDEPQDFKVLFKVIEDGEEVRTRTKSATIPGMGSGQEIPVDAGGLWVNPKKDAKIVVVVDSDSDIEEVQESNNDAEKEIARPKVKDLKAGILGNFLEAIRVDNDYTAIVQDPDVGKPVDRVRYTLEDQWGGTVREWTMSNRDADFELTVNMGQFIPGEYKLKAVAITEDDIESDPKEEEVVIWKKPLLFLTLAHNPLFVLLGTKVKYFGDTEITFRTPEFKSPGGVLEAALCGSGSSGTQLTWKMKFNHEVLSTSSAWKIGAGGGADFKFLGKFKASGSIGGSGEWIPNGVKIWEWDLKQATINGGITVAFTCDVLGFIVNKFPVVGWIADYLLSIDVTIGGGLPSWKIVFNENSQPELVAGLGFKEATGDVGVILGVKPVVGPSWLNLAVSLSGTALSATLGIDTAGFGLKKISLCTGGCPFKIEGTAIWVSGTILEFDLIPEIRLWDVAPPPAVWTDVHVAPRTHVGLDDYGTLVGETDGTLATGLPIFAQPTVAANARGDTLYAYAFDDPTRVRPASVDVRALLVHTDGTWDDLHAASSDLAEFAPTVALADDGRALVAWHEFAEPLTLEDDPFDHFQDVRLVARAYEPATGTWGAPAIVDESTGWPHEAQAVALPGGGFAVGWVEDADGNLSTLSDKRVRLATSPDGRAFAPALDASAQGYIVGAPSLATTVLGGPALAWVEDTDGNATTRHDRVVHAAQLVAGSLVDQAVAGPGPFSEATAAALPTGLAVAWRADGPNGSTVQATNVPELPGASPTAEATTDATTDATVPPGLLAGPGPVGTPVQAAPALTPLPRPAAAPQAVATTAGTPVELVEARATLGRPQLAPGPGGTLVLSARVADGPDDPLRLDRWLIAETLDGGLVPVDDGATLMDQADLGTTAVATGGDTVRAVGAAHRSDGAVDLVTASDVLGPDVAITQFLVDPPNPAPGVNAVVDILVENRGVGTLGPSVLEVRVNEGFLRAEPIAKLTPGERYRSSAVWTVPTEGAPHTITTTLEDAVDGAVHDEEARVVSLPDPAVRGASAVLDGALANLTVTVANEGVAPTAGVELVVEDQSGEVQRVPLDVLAPGASIDRSVLVDGSGLSDDALEVHARVEAALDADPANNAYEDALPMAPDLRIGALDVTGELIDGTPATLHALVSNEGELAAPATVARVSVDGVVLTDVTVPPLAPGASTTFEAPWTATTGIHQLEAVVDPDGAVTRDVHRANNEDHTTFKVAPELDPEPITNEASLAFGTDGILVTARNTGDAYLGNVPFALYRGEPQDPPKYGKRFVTTVPNLVAQGSVPDLSPGESATIQVPYTDVDVATWNGNETLSVRLDPFGELAVNDASNDVHVQGLVAITSQTHPVPGVPRADDAPSFELTTPAGRTVTGYSVVLDQAPTTDPGTTVTQTSSTYSASGLADGVHWLHARAQFSDGTWTSPDHFPVEVDLTDDTPPTVDILVGEPLIVAGSRTHVLPSTPIEVVAEDPVAPSSGVASVAYRVDGGTWQTYAGAFTLPAGEHALEVRATDGAGNTATPPARTFVVEVDDQAPITTLTGPRVHDGSLYIETFDTLELAAYDPSDKLLVPASGVDVTEYRVDAGAWQAYEGPFSVPGPDGEVVVEYRSRDVAGNVETTHVAQLVRDSTGPATSITSHRHGDYVHGPTIFVVETGDGPGIGLDRVELYRDAELIASVPATEDGSYQVAVDTTDWPFGNQAVTAVATDALGNQGVDLVRVYVVSLGPTVWTDPEENVDRYTPPGAP